MEKTASASSTTLRPGTGLARLLQENPAPRVAPTLDGESQREEIISVCFHQRVGGRAEAACRR
jgi:hypothetical protein